MTETKKRPACRVVVLISGRGSNLQSLINGTGHYQIVGVISNQAAAAGLGFAAAANIPSQAITAIAGETRAQYDQRLSTAIQHWQPDLVCLAGFMRILSADFVAQFNNRLLNIHPSLLPKYRGLHTHRRALEAGDSKHGASVHFVTAELDGGPVVAQMTIPVLTDDTEASLAQRLLEKEHNLYPTIVNWFAVGRLQCHSGQPQLDGKSLSSPTYID